MLFVSHHPPRVNFLLPVHFYLFLALLHSVWNLIFLTMPPAVEGRFRFFFFLLYIYIIYLFWLCWVFAAAQAFLQLWRAGATLRLPGEGFSARWPLVVEHWLQGSQASVVVTRGLSSCHSRALEHRLHSRGTQAQLPGGMWDFSRLGIKPTSPALAGGFFSTEPSGKLWEGRFLTTGPPGKSLSYLFKKLRFNLHVIRVQI